MSITWPMDRFCGFAGCTSKYLAMAMILGARRRVPLGGPGQAQREHVRPDRTLPRDQVLARPGAGKPVQQGPERDGGLPAGEVRAEAEVDAMAEGQVRVGGSVSVEGIRF